MTILPHYFMRPFARKRAKAKKNEHRQSSGCRQDDKMVNRALLVAAKQFRGGRLKCRAD
jgi:hypothetical protein